MIKQKGQTLIEVLLAFSALILVLGAVVLGITKSLSNTQYTKSQNLANSYAQEGLAVVRQIRDSSWINFLSQEDVLVSNTTYCLGQSPMELRKLELPYQTCWAQSPVGGNFSREVEFDHQSAKCCPDNTDTCALLVRGSETNITVSWSDNKCPVVNADGSSVSESDKLCHKVKLATCFFNLDQRPTP